MAFLLCYHFHNAISHSITFAVAQNTIIIAHTSHQWLLITILHSFIYSHIGPMIPLQTLTPPLSFPGTTLCHQVWHRTWCQNVIYIHFGSCITKHYSHLEKKPNHKTFTWTHLFVMFSAGALPTQSHILLLATMEIQHNSNLNMNKA